jgi:hypothetical protein
MKRKISHWRNKSLKNLRQYVKGVGWVKEEWKDAKGFKGLYEVSSFGRVKSLILRKQNSGDPFMALVPKRKGYLAVDLYKNTQKYTFLVHRLVAFNFTTNPKRKPDINHKNGVTGDNIIYNLEWATKSENQQHALRTGLRVVKFGQDIWHSLFKNSEALKIFNSKLTTTDLAKKYNVLIEIISGIKTGKTYSSVTGKKWNPKKRLDRKTRIVILKSKDKYDDIRDKFGVSKRHH